MSIEVIDIINFAKANKSMNCEITMHDYVRTAIKVSYTEDDDGFVDATISLEDFTSYSNWREIVRGGLKDIEVELQKIATFSGEVTTLEVEE